MCIMPAQGAQEANTRSTCRVPDVDLVAEEEVQPVETAAVVADIMAL
jgi:hypothetical protein